MTLRFYDHLEEVARGADVILSDIWGVIHDGLASFAEACAALQTFRNAGGTVILITNAPRPADSVQRQLRKLGVPDDTYDAIVSSGDLTRLYVTENQGKKVYRVGPERDNSVYRDLDVAFAPLAEADFVVCTGLFDDETETPDDYRDIIEEALARRLTMVCANPDIVVEKGDRLIYCAGAIADAYARRGGKVIYYGKPHRPIYDRALELAREKRSGGYSRVLAIGDSVRTDLTGANAMNLDLLFVTRGIHSDEFKGRRELDDAAVTKLFGDARLPFALMHELKW